MQEGKEREEEKENKEMQIWELWVTPQDSMSTTGNDPKSKGRKCR